MIKCPNCGSTAQVRPISATRYLGDYRETSYECSCKCRFTIEFHDRFNVRRGHWEIKDDTKTKNLFQS